jgi:hypothetical protein
MVSSLILSRLCQWNYTANKDSKKKHEIQPARLLQQMMQNTTSYPKIFDTHPSKKVGELLPVLKPVTRNLTSHTDSIFQQTK